MANARHRHKLAGKELAADRGHRTAAGTVCGDILAVQPELVVEFLRKPNRLSGAGHKFRDTECECRVCESK